MNMQKEGYRSSADVWFLMLQWLLSGIPLLCLRICDDSRIGSICIHCLDFPAGFLCREVLLTSISPPFPQSPQGQAWEEHTIGLSSAPAGFCPIPVFSECREKHEYSPYMTSTKALWGFAVSLYVPGISLWFFIVGPGIFYSRPAQNFITRFTKTPMNKGHITVFAFCGKESKKILFVEMNDQSLWLSFPFLLW